MYPTLMASQERIAFQKKSPLGDGLASFIQAYMASSRMESDKRKFMSVVGALATRESGYDITMRTEAMGSFRAGILTTTANTTLSDMIDDQLRISGQRYKRSRVPSDLFKELAQDLDLDTGRMMNPKYSRLFKAEIYVAHEFFTGDRFDAQEIAAIILHEIGHLISDTERLGDTFHRCAMAHDALDLMFRDPKVSPKVLVGDAVATARKILAAEKGRGAKTVLKGLSVYDRDYSDMERPKSRWSDLARLLILLPLKAILTLYVIRYLYRLISRARSSKEADLTNPDADRLADSLGGTARRKYNEQWSDEFVAQHGYALPLQTALHKLVQYEVWTRSRSLEALGSIKRWMSASDSLRDGRDNPSELPYDEMDDRTEQLLRHAQASLTAKGLSPKMKKDLVVQVRQIRKNQAAFRKRYDQEKRFRQILQWIEDFSQRRIPITFSGSEKKRLMDDYARLRDQSGGLLKNPFGYHAARIDILRKGKT